jgi:enamine deaminase RidA (YjgF/YER057c/UK114 family)
MASRIEEALRALGLALPEPASPRANYVPFVRSGALVFTAGQLPLEGGRIAVAGKLGAEVGIEQGREAARLCALNLLAHLKTACDGDLDRVVRCVRVGGFVNCVPDFTEQPQVVNGASDLLVAVMGDAGRHARTAVGVASLPRGAAVEVEAVFEIA